MPVLVGCDTGGTFTDFVMYQPGPPPRYQILKLSSTPDDPGQAVLEGLSRLCGGALVSHLNHATTVATNALLERTGGRVAFFCTEGFRDMLWLGRGQRDELYALAPSRVLPPLEQSDCFTVKGRLNARGEELEPLGTLPLDGLLEGYDAGAVCLLHSTANPLHEEQLCRVLAERFPRLFASSKLSASSGEYERGMTTLLAAYLSPKVEGYLQNLLRSLPQSELNIVHSAGGLLTPSEAVQNPHRLALSGPAAGLRGALSVGARCGLTDLITLDMGGTSTDVALICNGELPYKWATKIENFPLLAPTLEIHTIGAGGGSLALCDPSGFLRVGPQSAGAQPGPACYARGGREPTVTDALYWNGLLPEFLGDERLPLERDACRSALAHVARNLSLDIDSLADGILEVTAHHLAQAVRKVTTARGQDPSHFTLFPFGGAGPLLCCQVSELLNIESVLVPARAGVLSAWGALTAPWEREWSLTVPLDSREDPKAATDLLRELEKRAARALGAGQSWSYRQFLARRYKGQGETLVSSPEDDFHLLHHSLFGFARDSAAVETLQVRVRACAPPLPSEEETAEAHFDEFQERALRWRGESLVAQAYSAGHRFSTATEGPLLWFQEGSTVFVAPDWTAHHLPSGHLRLERGGV